MIEIDLPLRIYSKANAREHWSRRYKRGRAEKEAAYLLTPKGIELPCTVTMTSIAPQLMDSDNLRSAFKAVRDGIALRLGVDDADPRVTWEYRQEKGRKAAARITIDGGRNVEGLPDAEQEATQPP